jgi:hypothetical protein
VAVFSLSSGFPPFSFPAYFAREAEKKGRRKKKLRKGVKLNK